MGYYVRTEASEFFIKKEDFQSCYKAMCKLNDYDHLKRGGGWGEDISSDDPRPEHMDYHPARWFSWMDANYPKEIATFHQMLMELGFSPTYDDDGNLVDLVYNNKQGQEDLFFCAISPWVKDESWIEWRGEDTDVFRWYFAAGQMRLQGAQLKWVEVEWGKLAKSLSTKQLVECWSAGQA